MTVPLTRREKLALRVLDAARELIDAGEVPSETYLAERVPGHSPKTLRAIRNELRDAGRLDWDHLRGRPPRRGGGLLGATAAERAEIEGCRDAIRVARMASGEDPPHVMGPRGGGHEGPAVRMPRVYRTPRFARDDAR